MLPGEYFHFVQFPKGPLGKGGNYGSTINSHETHLTEDISVCVIKKNTG